MELVWNIIDKYFKDNKDCLVKHHLDSYNNFFGDGIKQVFKEKNPIKVMKQQDPDTKEFNLRCELFLGGKNGNLIYYGKPIIHDNNRTHLMYPNEARLRNMTYGITIHYDVEVDFFIKDLESTTGEFIEKTITLEKIFLGTFPIMLQSNFCILNNLSSATRFNLGECRNDRGGYYIIDGKEKVIVCQEKFADNLVYVKDNVNDLYSHSAEIRSVSEDASKPVRTMSIRIVRPSTVLSNNQIVVNVPNVKKPVPLFILMRALGITSDKSIIEHCLLDLELNNDFIDLFIPSIHDAGYIFNRIDALKYIATFTKGKTIEHVIDILMNYFLPHIGELNFKQKAYFVGYMVKKLLMVFTGKQKATDRDSFRFKRVETPGILLYDLFKEYYTLQQRDIFLKIDKEYYYHEGMYQGNFMSLIENNYKEFFKDRIVEKGFKKAFKGNWGSEAHTKREGVVQDLNRLSYNSFLSHLRKVNLPLEASAKIVGPHLLHNSQYGIIDHLDTPDGGNVGLHKHMSIAAYITQSCSAFPIIKWLRKNVNLQILEEASIRVISNSTKILVNGNWVGIVEDPDKSIKKIHLHRQLALLPIYMSAHWDLQANEIIIYTDGGRLTRPIFNIEDELPSFERKKNAIVNKKFSWEDLTCGFNKKPSSFDSNTCDIYDVNELYGGDDLEKLIRERAVIQYLDTAEEESTLIAMSVEDIGKKRYTHLEIHPSLALGVMGNQIVFPENNQLPRDLFSCGQSKQAVSLYHSNYQNRIDKMGVVLNAGQIPLVKSRYLKYIYNEEHTYGMNAIVAIMCNTGYNVEDSILFNEASVKRGMFRTTYFNMYETYEENVKSGNSVIDSHFANIESENVVGLKPGYDYSELNKYGIIKENTKLDDKKVLIGKVTNDPLNPDVSIDSSIFPKKGQLGFVDKSFITEGEDGFRIAKVRIREERIPAIGDKFCSRCGQKGTVGLIIPEEDMPFTEEGLRPDLIINPHAIPSRMTIGQLVECIIGKVGSMYGAFGDCTAFVNKGPKHIVFGNLLQDVGYHSSGNQVLYNGITGHQLDANIFIGPTYYMRLKHMVKDKINYRAQGPRTLLTRQTVQGRANDGGLRIGEMERDGIIAHGATRFLQESLMVRGDDYYMAVCNQTGTIAIYNSALNLFLSPLIDGPIKFTGTLDNKMNIENVSRYGRSFSIVRVPYCFKLLMQELQTMNIQMRIITEKNIDQLESLSYSNNINKLFYDNDIQPNDIINANKEILQNNNDGTITVSSVKRDYTNVAAPSNIQEENMPIQDVRQIADDPFLPSQDVDPFDDKPVQTIESDDPFADVIQEVSLSEFGKNNPAVLPQDPSTSPQYPSVSPQYPSVSPQYPAVSPQGIDTTQLKSPTSDEKPLVKATIEVPVGQKVTLTSGDEATQQVSEPTTAQEVKPNITPPISIEEEKEKQSPQLEKEKSVTTDEPQEESDVKTITINKQS